MKKRFEWDTDDTAAEFLRKLDGHLAKWADDQRDNERNFGPRKFIQDLWFLISAQRGPDNGDWYLKQQTTALIRYLTLPRVASIGGADVNDYVTDSTSTVPGEYHFMDHVKFALVRLGYDVVISNATSVGKSCLFFERSPK